MYANIVRYVKLLAGVSHVAMKYVLPVAGHVSLFRIYYISYKWRYVSPSIQVIARRLVFYRKRVKKKVTLCTLHKQ